MVKLTILYGFPKEPADFEDYYANRHLPFAQKNMPNVRQAESSRVVGTLDESQPPYYRIAQMSYDSMEALRAGIGSREGQAVLADLSNFATGGVTLFVTEDD